MSEAWSADNGSIDGTWHAWRNRALNAVMIAGCVLGAPFAIPGAMGEAALLPKWQPLGMAIYLLGFLATISPQWGFRARSWIAVVVAYLAACLALTNRGLIGYGRIGLAVYPCWIIVLLGRRAGWGAVAASLGIYIGFAALSVRGVVPHADLTMDDNAPSLWLAQGLGLALAIVPTVVLLNWFRVHYMRTLEIERRISKQLQEEVARRTAAHESLDREHAERLRLEEEISQLSEEERQHLGREIHDGLCQQLTAALLRCTALHEQLNSRQVTEAAQAERLRMLIQEMLDDAYVISKGVWPMGPEPDALVPALQAMAKRTSEESGLRCEFRHQGDIAVTDSQMAMHLYRIAQEAVNNSVKHAKASRVGVLLQGDADVITLTMTDDGTGPPNGDGPRHGMGLSIMTYRARTMGGTLTIAQAGSGGTVVSCQVPCRRTESLEGACGGN